MTKKEILDYVMNTPHNTNRAVLSGMLDSISEGGDTPTTLYEIVQLDYSENVDAVSAQFSDEIKGYTGKCHVGISEGAGTTTIKCTEWTTEEGDPLSQEIINYMEPIIQSAFDIDVYSAFLEMVLENNLDSVPIIIIKEEK